MGWLKKLWGRIKGWVFMTRDRARNQADEVVHNARARAKQVRKNLTKTNGGQDG